MESKSKGNNTHFGVEKRHTRSSEIMSIIVPDQRMTINANRFDLRVPRLIIHPPGLQFCPSQSCPLSLRVG